MCVYTTIITDKCSTLYALYATSVVDSAIFRSERAAAAYRQAVAKTGLRLRFKERRFRPTELALAQRFAYTGT